MDRNHHNNNGGFLIGVFVGIAIALLFTTKKGRRILRIITDEGLEKFSEWENIVKGTLKGVDDIEDAEEGSDYIDSTTPRQAVSENQEDHVDDGVHHDGAPVAADKTVAKLKTNARRFFRGVPRRN